MHGPHSIHVLGVEAKLYLISNPYCQNTDIDIKVIETSMHTGVGIGISIGKNMCTSTDICKYNIICNI